MLQTVVHFPEALEFLYAFYSEKSETELAALFSGVISSFLLSKLTKIGGLKQKYALSLYL
jgi:hypothetical protein